VVVDVDVVTAAQPLAVQASQQLSAAPRHALPPAGGVQRAGSVRMLHLVTPLRVRQQVEAPGRPQTERATQRRTVPRHDGGSAPVAVSSARTVRVQRR
jgi:hypothetical protein